MNQKNNTKRKSNPKHETESTAECGGTGPINNWVYEKLNHSQAMAQVLVSGLSVLGFNPNAANPRAEFGFIGPHHGLVKMEIYKNGCPNLYWSTQRPADFPPGSTKDITITINSTKTGLGRRYRGEEGIPTDSEDFRHIPSFVDLHGKRLDIKGNAKSKLSARLDIHDATFYTYLLSSSSTTLIPKHDDNPNDDLPSPYRAIGRVIGADILSDSNLVIKIEHPTGTELVPPLTLPKEAGTQYTIVITTRP